MFNEVVGLRTLTARPFAAHLGPRIAGGGPLVTFNSHAVFR